MFLFLFNQSTWPAPEGAEGEERGGAATVSVQSSSTCKQNGAQLTRCVFCSAVTGRHSTSMKLLFIYLKTCIPWKKMPQDSTVFLKLNAAGWRKEGASTPVLPPAAGTGLPMSQAPPPLPSCRRAWQNNSHILSQEGVQLFRKPGWDQAPYQKAGVPAFAQGMRV